MLYLAGLLLIIICSRVSTLLANEGPGRVPHRRLVLMAVAALIILVVEAGLVFESHLSPVVSSHPLAVSHVLAETFLEVLECGWIWSCRIIVVKVIIVVVLVAFGGFRVAFVIIIISFIRALTHTSSLIGRASVSMC